MSLDVRELTFGYEKNNNIIDSLSLKFEYGKITALRGRNGVGKTTLARLIMGILKPESGSVYVDDRCIDDYTLAQRGRLIGYAMQNPARQIFSETVEKEIKYGLDNLGLPIEEKVNRIDEYLEIFELEKYRDRLPFELSGGEKQRLVLAAVMAMKPRYLILDEPTSGMDMRRKENFGKLIGECCNRCGVIVITHDKKFTEKYCSEVVILE